MSTPSTLSAQTLHHPLSLDHRPYLPSPQDRYLPPPRPSSNLSNRNIPARPSSNLSNHQIAPPPPRTQSGMSNGGYSHPHAHGHSQARGGAEQPSYTNGLTQQRSHEELKRTNSAASQHSRRLPPPNPSSRAPAESSMPSNRTNGTQGESSAELSRKVEQKQSVDWIKYFGGKPPAEIITIHDDDSPAPAAEVEKLPPPTNGTSTTQHVGKKRRTNGGSGEANNSTTNTPYSHSNGTSTESLQATTAPTSLGSTASSGSRLDGAQTGQKRKRTTRGVEQERKKQEKDRSGPRGYLAEYGEYVPPLKQGRKQKDVNVPIIHDVCITCKVKKTTTMTDSSAAQRHKTHDKIDDEDGHYLVNENSRLGERYNLLQMLGQGTFGKVVKAIDIRTRREVAVKIIRAVPKVRTPTLSRFASSI